MADAGILSLALDGAILILLVVTIIYAARLSLYLKRFRNNKAELEAIITDLSRHIARADQAIHALDENVKRSAGDLQARMDRANAMFDELQMIVESGDSMATRLEALAVKNRKILEGDAGDLDELRRMTADTDRPYDERLEAVVRQTATPRVKADVQVSAPASPFNIRDVDAERGEAHAGFDDDGEDDDGIMSEAERDLYKALQGKAAKKGGGAG